MNKRNLLYLILILFGTVFGIIYFYSWKNVLNSSMNKQISLYFDYINFNEINSYLVDNKDFVIYLTNENNFNNNNFFKELKSFLNKNNYNTKILYTYLSTESEINNFNNTYNCNIKEFPVFVAFKNRKVYSIFNLSSNDFDLDLKLYLNSVIEND